jgi:WD40 repeat protein
MAPIENSAMEEDPSIPKLLSTLTGHMGAVNCVRWSSSGYLCFKVVLTSQREYLASGADDNIVMLWKKSDMMSLPSLGEKATPEKWISHTQFRGHTMGIQRTLMCC